MLIPLTRQTFESIVPLVATGPQYSYYWGNWQDFLRRLLISSLGILVFRVTGFLLGEWGITLILITISFFYWLWGPVYWASLRNASYRRFLYSGFLRGRIIDVFITEELINKGQSVNQRGELVIIENREKYLNLEIADETGFITMIKAPLKRAYKGINPGQIAELVVLSNQPDLSRIAKITDAYIPSRNLWFGEYPYLRRDTFIEVSRQLSDNSRMRRS
jgi:hypothetical protein